MKKFIFLLFFVFFNTNIVFAESWVCSIENNTPELVLDYIKNEKKIIKNISNKIRNSEKDKNTDYTSKVKKIYNRISSYEMWWTYTYYNTVYKTFSDVPYSVERDIELLKNEDEDINIFFDSVIKSKKLNVKIEKNDVCSWVENCNFSWNLQTAWDYIWEILLNNQNIINLFRRTVINLESKWKNYILVDKNFENEVSTLYDSENIKLCDSRMKDLISDKKENIKNIWKKINNWYAKWDEAIAMMRWKESKEQQEKREKEILIREMSRQWVPYSKQQNMLQNLKDFNTNWLSLSNNIVVNSLKAINNELKKIKEEITKPFSDFFWEDNWDGSASTNINKLNSDLQNYSDEVNLKTRISELYFQMNWLEASGQEKSLSILSNIKKIHESLSKTINILENTYDISTNVCESQWGKWSCN